eukprot:71488_1
MTTNFSKLSHLRKAVYKYHSIKSKYIANKRYFDVYRENGNYATKTSFSKKIPSGDSKERHVCNHCGFIEYSNPKIATGILATHNNKILLTQRNIDPGRGLWCFPGGFLESGESPHDGIIREIREEIGADIILGPLIGVYSVPYVDQIMLYFRGELKNEIFNLGEECQDAKLFDYNEIQWDKIAFDANKMCLKFWENNQDNNAVEMFTFRHDTN